ncbi:Chromokinesin kid-A [Intoshia linei]|uniref:Kinesin-like protein n=1 Tax=Intoshia linei TaxID=1819745 RepID=A0A177B136_9BILA|nr:Chromokinesin kid-A [Intoshia linei]
MSTRVKVAVRLRPMNQRELKIGGDCIVKIKNNRTEVIHPKRRDVKPKVFTFDNCFWSCDNSQHFVDQSEVFESIGTEVVQHSFDGFNSCIFAYGQTGSGKSYTMMGSKSDIGLIPRVANELITTFENMNCKTNRIVLELSYMEIYNEKVKDLLNPQSPSNANIYLKVRENKSYGTYVDGLSKLVVNSYDEIEKHISFGSLSRSVAQTNMNNESSRSHAVLTIYVTQIAFDSETKTKSEKVSKLSLVDLAGSERAEKTGAKGDRLREGSNINKSLTTLGLVISALADAKKKNNFVPYRDSVLTWLLKDNLGGNSKTIMMATISPSGDNYEETLSTLRYANSAKNITNLAVINEDPTTALIRELREELDRLRLVVANKSVNSQSITSLSTLNDTIDANERLMKDISKTYDEKLEETAKIDSCRLNSLREIGVTIEKQGITVKKNTFYLINLSSDPSLDLMLVYYLNVYFL